MSGTDFGTFLKSLRKAQGVSSKKLSQSVGKAVTYVSQLERGLIKKPDYDACVALLKHLKVSENEIEMALEHFNILSPERMQYDLDLAIKRFEREQDELESDPEGYAERQFAEMLEARIFIRKDELMRNNQQFHRALDLLIDKDVARAETVLPNLGKMVKDLESFDFFCLLFSFDYSVLNQDKKEKILNHIGGVFNE